ncbi:hypothetical protein AN958_01185 [Leucoagaricus sp. SymC.cos]|nr:hypothetical protein AN958_01185 [Leucoagaricus sp. SymC.cos]
MSRVEPLTLRSLFNLVNLNGLYLLGYAWAFGMAVWVTFFAGIIAFKTLPRQQFGALQHKIFPVYFVQSMVLTSGLLVKWIYSHPDVIPHFGKPWVADVAQVYALGTVLALQGTNYFIIGPMTSRAMFERHKLEKEENKQYNDPAASAEMKALNQRFGALHGISSLANLGAVIVLGFHGLWIGSAGVKGY